MGKPTFDLYYSNDTSAGAQSGGSFDVFFASIDDVKHSNRASDFRSEGDAELMRGVQKPAFGLIEVTMEVFVTEYIGNKS